MKTKHIFLGALFALASSAYAQTSLTFFLQPQTTRGGAFYAPTSGSSNPTYVATDRKLTTGISLGGLISIPLNDKMHVATGLCYSKYGQKTYYETSQPYGSYTDNFTMTSKVSLHYLQLPARFIFEPATEKKIGFYISGGIYFGMLLAYKHDVEGEDNISNGDWDRVHIVASGDKIDRTDSDSNGDVETYTVPFLEKPFHGTDFGMQLGAGVTIKVSEKMTVPIGLAGSLGMRNVKNETSQWTDSNTSDAQLYWKYFYEGSDPNKTAKYKNSSLGLNIGVRIML